ncbi:hypothetical protein [Halocola ammonii]
MEDKEKYKDIKSLTAELAKQVKALETGELAAGDLDSMAEKSRELYERIIVIRHLAYERIVKNKTEGSMAKEPREMPFRINMNRPPISKNQTSLIDVIEELTAGEEDDFADESKDESTASTETNEVQEETVEEESEKDVQETVESEEETVAEEEQPEEVEEEVAKDEEPSEEAPEEVEEEVAEEEQELPEVKIEPESESEPAPMEEQIEEKLSSPATRSTEQPETLADRLKMTPLADLKKAIGLNQKFQFINELFEGDADEYADSIEKLNSADNMESAIKYFEKDLAAKNDWEEDHPSVLDLRELVQRRYL